MFYADDADDGRKVMTITHMALWARRAKNALFALRAIFNFQSGPNEQTFMSSC